MTVLLNIFMRQTLTDDFCGLHKNMNCAFPLKIENSAILENKKKNVLTLWPAGGT